MYWKNRLTLKNIRLVFGSSSHYNHVICCMNTPSQIENTVRFFFELGTLRKVARAHRQVLLTNDLTDNISTHSFRCAFIGYFLAKMEKVDSGKVMLMCLLHDVPESRSGDQNWIHKKYVKVFEDEILKDQLDSIPGSDELLTIVKEYGERKSLEAKLAKDADLLDQILLLREYEWTGNKEALAWLSDNEQVKRLSNVSAKKLAKEILAQKPHSWWNTIWTAERR